MATEYDDDGNPIDDTGNDIPGLRKHAKELEKQLNQLKTQNEDFQRKDAIRSAGLDDLSEVQIKALAAVHGDGDQSADSLRQAAESLGFVQPKETVAKEVQEAHNRVANAAATAQTQASTSKEDEYRNAKTPAEVMEIAQRHGSVTTWDMYNQPLQ